jgi:4-hydroxy-tetrahydrodipicolinate reductase
MASRVVALGGGEISATLGLGSTPDFSAADVWIEFAMAEATPLTIAGAVAAGRALVVCTTGLSEATIAAAHEAARKIPLMIAANTSLGVAVLQAALRLATRALPGYACEIVELHHGHKRDAPSGTALRLAEVVKEARPQAHIVTGREGLVGAREANELGVLAVRGGGVVGEHTAYLFGEHERLELTHRAQDRDLFAHGALTAARWLAAQPAGFYRIEQCLGLGE